MVSETKHASVYIEMLMTRYAELLERIEHVTEHCKKNKIDPIQQGAMVHTEIRYWFANSGELRKKTLS